MSNIKKGDIIIYAGDLFNVEGILREGKVKIVFLRVPILSLTCDLKNVMPSYDQPQNFIVAHLLK